MRVRPKTSSANIFERVFDYEHKRNDKRRFDSKAFKQTHSELYNQYCKQTEYKRFSVA